MPPADGSSTRGGSTSVRGRVRSPHISGGRPAAGNQRADSLGSCATQPACYKPTLGQTDGRIAVSLNAPLRRGHNKYAQWSTEAESEAQKGEAPMSGGLQCFTEIACNLVG